MAKLVAVRLSRTENRVQVDAKGGIDGKASLSEKNKKFVVLEFEDDLNIFKVSRSARSYWMNGEGDDEKWSGLTPEKLLQYVGKTIPGEFVTESVSPYQIVGDDGISRTVGKFTMFVMPHEIGDTMISKAGHNVLNDDGSIRTERVTTRENAGQPVTM